MTSNFLFIISFFAILPPVWLFSRVHIPPGGRETGPHEFPWMVTLKTFRGQFESGNLISTCGGGLLALDNNDQSSDIVLTAAHCIVRKQCTEGSTTKNITCVKTKGQVKPSDLTVHLGSHSVEQLEEGEQRVHADKTEYHPEYNYESVIINDVALIKLAESIQFTDTIKPIYLPKQDDAMTNLSKCGVAGWGDDDEDKIASDVLRYIDVSGFVDGDRCVPGDMINIPGLLENVLCATAKNQDATICGGDSGSPLWCYQNEETRPVVYGIVSAGAEPCTAKTQPGVFMKVTKYVNWIKDTIKAWKVE